MNAPPTSFAESAHAEMPRILLATSVSWPPPARLVGAFAAVGCEVDAIAPGSHPLRASRYLSRGFVLRANAPSSSLWRAIAEAAPDLIVPCDDRMVLHLIQLYDEAVASAEDSGVRELLERSLGRPDEYLGFMQRSSFSALAVALGLKVPLTRALNSQDDLATALRDLSLPLVLKRDHTSGGTGVHIAGSLDEAFAVHRQWSGPRHRARRSGAAAIPSALSAQQYVAGEPVTTSFACWRGEVVAAFHLDVLKTERERGPSCVVRRIESDAMDAAARAVAARLGLSGLHGLDYIRDEAGELHLLEINPRATATAYLPFGAEKDLVAALASHAAGLPVVPRRPIPHTFVALFPHELARDPNSAWLKDAYHDVPGHDPGLRRRLLRSVLRARAARSVRSLTERARALSALGPRDAGA